MLTLLADMLFTATGRRHPRPPVQPDRSHFWAGRFDGRERLDPTKPPYRFNRHRDLW